MPSYDRRLTPARDDLAASHLKGTVDAERFVDGIAHQVIVGHCNLHAQPRRDDGLDTQLHCGQMFIVYEEREGWAWGQVDFDGYVGYVPADALSKNPVPTTHRVTALRSFVYPGPSIKLLPVDTLSLNAEVAVERQHDGFAVTPAGYIFGRHISPKDQLTEDVVECALDFLGIPYLWGGRTSFGIDCSGLVQEAFLCAGMTVPRDADLQEKSIGQRINEDNSLNGLRRGDLIFWDRHVGIMVDGQTLLHANAHHMCVAEEPLSKAVERIAAVEGPVTSIRRPDPVG